MKKFLIIMLGIVIVLSACNKDDDNNANPNANPNPIPEFKPTVVKTDPRHKNAIIECFTGVQSQYCPQGHAILQGILDANPGRAFGVSYHPFGPCITEPYPGEEDLRRSFVDVFFATSFSGSQAMPTAMIGRRVWNDGKRSQSRNMWDGYVSTIMSEDSPVNVGVTSRLVGDTLVIDVELYYTEVVANGHTLFCYLSESGIITKQDGGGDTYEHKRVFRESFSTQWGEPLTVDKIPGTFIRYTYKYFYSGSTYDMNQCQILAFIRDADTEEIITGNGADVGESTPGPND